MNPPPQLPPTQQRDVDHLKLLTIFHFIFAGLCLLGIGFLFLHYTIMHTFFANPDIWKNSKNPPPNLKEFFDIFIYVYVAFGIIFLIAAVVNAIAALFLQQRRHRTFTLVIAGLNCLQVPFGTALGVFTFLVLMRDSVRSIYKS